MGTIITMFRSYALRDLVGQLNDIKVDDNWVTSMDKFVGDTMGMYVKYQHISLCPVYVLDTRLKNANTSGLPK